MIVGKKATPANDLKEFIAYLKANAIEDLAGQFRHRHAEPYRRACCSRRRSARRSPMCPIAAPDSRRPIWSPAISTCCSTRRRSRCRSTAPATSRRSRSPNNHRLETAPDIPTTDEAGLPGFYFTFWHALWAPKGTPKEIIAKLNAALVKALSDPTIRRQRLTDLSQRDIPAGPAHARGARRLPPRRDREVVADHQGGRRYGAVMLEKTQRVRRRGGRSTRRWSCAASMRFAVALPLKSPMKMAGITISTAENLLVRVEATGRHGRLGRGTVGADDDRRHARRPHRRRCATIWRRC